MTSPTDPTRSRDALPSTEDTAEIPLPTPTSTDDATTTNTASTLESGTAESGTTELGDTARDTSKNSIGNIR